MRQTEVLIIGGGPSGLCAAIEAAGAGAQVTLMERYGSLGGQLPKQTHRFFGSKSQFASLRGFEISHKLREQVESYHGIDVLINTTALGLYADHVITADCNGVYQKFKPEAIILATGASEKYLSFANNDLPGIYGAGAVQTLMNIHGVKPGHRAIMVGAGNIGLIVSYQLIQAGMDVAMVVEAAPRIGGYLVHASKLRRLGVPIRTRSTVIAAHGNDRVEGATIADLDDQWEIIPNTEKFIPCDLICVSVGLSSLTQLAWQSGCEMKYTAALGGFVPLRDELMMTTREGLFVAGDVAGIEEASSAMIEGKIAGLSAARYAGYEHPHFRQLIREANDQLANLRAGPEGLRIRTGIREVMVSVNTRASDDSANETLQPQMVDDYARTGIAGPSEIDRIWPSGSILKEGPKAIIECLREIPCDPCFYACPSGAILSFEDINDIPRIDHHICSGCGLCVTQCPGLAIRIVDMLASDIEAYVTVPYEQLPRPEVDQEVEVLGRDGSRVGLGKIVKVKSAEYQNKTMLVTFAVARNIVRDAVSFRLINSKESNFTDDNTIICRCSDVTRGDIRRLIQEGYRTLDEIKRLSRAGMGPCQGQTCGLLIMKEISEMTGMPMESIAQGTARPLIRSMKLGDIADGSERKCK
jgi:thioredoxin reductase/Fe-S-cluster-containing hydrogenase component 2/bacterioferritin-associated ferredoxin